MSAARVLPLTPIAAAEYPDKEYATLRAKAALQGATLHRIEDDRGAELFVVSKWNLTRHLDDLEAVSAWLDQLEGKAS